MNDYKIGLFIDGTVGIEVAHFVITKHFEDLAFICVTNADSPLINQCIKFGCPETKIFSAESLPHDMSNIDYFILVWWPYIVKESLFKIPQKGTLNFHPSFLPYNKGKHPTFWNIIEEVQYGVTIHFVDKGIDSGDIVFQQKIKKDWTDTGFSLYQKALKAIVQLFIDNYENIKSGNYARKNQRGTGSFHFSKELAGRLEINLDTKTTIRELLNLLRAKDFPNSPQCYFRDKNKKYAVKITINREVEK